MRISLNLTSFESCNPENYNTLRLSHTGGVAVEVHIMTFKSYLAAKATALSNLHLFRNRKEKRLIFFVFLHQLGK